MNDLIERLRAMAGSDMVPMEKVMQLLTEAADALEEARAEREVIVAEAIKYAGKSGRLEAKVYLMAEALREIESRTWNGVRPIQIAARSALRKHDQENK